MKTISLYTLSLLTFCTFLVIACGGEHKEQASYTENTADHSKEVVDIDAVDSDLPKAEGYQTFYSNCVVCHSPRYIQNQPDMPEKSWAAIVTKMQKTFGAPVSDSSAQIIVQYLVAIKGTK